MKKYSRIRADIDLDAVLYNFEKTVRLHVGLCCGSGR